MGRLLTPGAGRLPGLIVGGNLLVALVLCTATLMNIQGNRETELRRARDAAQNLAQTLASELSADLRLIDGALATIASADAGDARQRATTEQKRRLPLLGPLRIVGEADLASCPKAAPEGVDCAFAAAVRDSDSMVLSEPVLGASGWQLLAARRLRTTGGGYGGMVTTALASSDFNSRFSRLALGRDGAVSLRTDAMRLVARHAPGETAVDRGLGGSQVSQSLRSAMRLNRETGSYITPTALDGIERVNAYRRLAAYPLTVVAGFSTDNHLAPWRASARRQWEFTAVTLVLVALGSALLHAQHRRERAARLRADRLAEEQNLLLENELVGMLRVREQQILWANRAACRMLGHAPQVLQGASTRLLYADDAAHALMAETSHEAMHSTGHYRDQIQVRCASGQLLWVDFSGALLPGGESIWMMADIDKLKQSEVDAHHRALHDPLTGLANRRLLEVQLRQALLQARRCGQLVAVAYLDLDGFKPINDRFGHDAGDAILRSVAARLERQVRPHDTVARLGGDEFALVLSTVESSDHAMAVLERCIDAVQQPFALKGNEQLEVGCSIGLAFSDGSHVSEDSLLQAADTAMLAAKRAGRGRILLAHSPTTPSETGGLSAIDG